MSQATEEIAACHICGEVFHGEDIHAHMRESIRNGEIVEVCRWHTTQ